MLLPYFSFDFDGIIWKILSDTLKPWLVAEIRNHDLHQANFVVIDIATGFLVCEGLDLEEDWWTGIEALHEGKLILYKYEDEQKPTHQGMYVYDAQSGKLCWQKPDMAYVGLGTGTIIGKQLELRHELMLDLNSGDEIENSQLIQLRDSDSIKNPIHYTEQSPYFETIASFINSKLNLKPVKAFDYLELEKYFIISYYIYNDKLLTNLIVVFNNEGEIVLNELLGTSSKGIGFDTFFVFYNQLIFISNKSTLISYKL